jgi:hypothetical protein
MSDEITEETQDSPNAVELALSLVKLFESAHDALPAPTKKFELGIPGRQVLHKVLASKIVHGYQLEFVMASGEVYTGFVIGLDDHTIQIISTGYDEDFNRIGQYKIKSHPLKQEDMVRHWLNLNLIETINEHYFGIKHLTQSGQDLINAERKGIVKVAERWLNPYARK